jgi:short-subunit dehydrogenase
LRKRPIVPLRPKALNLTILLANNIQSITGSSQGIGRATALECARHGARLVLNHLGDERAKADIATLNEAIEAQNQDIPVKAEVADIGCDITKPEAGQRYDAFSYMLRHSKMLGLTCHKDC